MPHRRTSPLPCLILSCLIFSSPFWFSSSLAQEHKNGTSPPAETPSQPTIQDPSGTPAAAPTLPDMEGACKTDPCPATEKKSSRILALVDKTHTDISNRLEATVKYADRFFADDNVFEETNKSYARLPLDIIYDQDNGLDLKIKVRARINLPNTNKKLKLLLSDAGSEDEVDSVLSPENDALQDNFTVSLETQLKKTGKWKVRPALGIKTNIPPDPFVRVRLIRYFAVTEKWLSRFSTTGTYLAMAGAEFDARAQFSRAIRKDILFRSTTRWKWTNEKGYSEGDQIFSLFQNINENLNVSYEAGIFTDNEDNWEISEYRLWHRYRKLVYKDWLFLELIPELRFRQVNHYDPSYRFTFRIEPVFGRELPKAKIRRVD